MFGNMGLTAIWNEEMPFPSLSLPFPWVNYRHTCPGIKKNKCVYDPKDSCLGPITRKIYPTRLSPLVDAGGTELQQPTLNKNEKVSQA